MFEYSSKREHDPFLWRRWEVTNVATGHKNLKKTKTTKKVQSARVAAKVLGTSKSEYCIVRITMLSSILWGADHLATDQLGIFRFPPYY